MRVDHLVPSFAPYDAIGNHVLELHRALGSAGHESRLYAEHIHPTLAGAVRPVSECPPLPPGQRVLLYQASTNAGFVPWMVERARAGETLVANYHNITPASFMDRFEPEAAAAMREGRRQLAELCPSVAGALADSDFNRRELDALGYPNTITARLLVDLDAMAGPPDPAVLDRLWSATDGAGRWLFVGRLNPNKCQHDVVAAFAAYRRLVDPRARLSLVGGASSSRYAIRVRALIRDLGIEDAVDLVGSVDAPTLWAHYRAADVFVCLSQHEGFCVPVLEAMALGVPVVARADTAVPETLGDAGVLIDTSEPLRVALTVADLQADAIERDHLIAKGRARAATFALDVTRPAFLDALNGVLASAD